MSEAVRALILMVLDRIEVGLYIENGLISVFISALELKQHNF